MKSAPLTDAEKNACKILSDLFLDNELTSMEMNHMAKSLEELNLPLSILDSILRHDLFPILIYNLMCITGEWFGFDERILIEQVERQRKSPPGILNGFGHYAAWLALGGMVTSSWNQIRARLQDIISGSCCPFFRAYNTPCLAKSNLSCVGWQ